MGGGSQSTKQNCTVPQVICLCPRAEALSLFSVSVFFFYFLESSLSLCLFILNRRVDQKRDRNDKKPKGCAFSEMAVCSTRCFGQLWLTGRFYHTPVSSVENCGVSTACGEDHTDQQASHQSTEQGWRALRWRGGDGVDVEGLGTIDAKPCQVVVTDSQLAFRLLGGGTECVEGRINKLRHLCNRNPMR